MKVSQSLAGGRLGEKEHANQRSSRAVRAGRELSVPRRVPASMPGRIWESYWPGPVCACVQWREGAREGGGSRKGTKNERESSFLLFLNVSAAFQLPSTHTFIV